MTIPVSELSPEIGLPFCSDTPLILFKEEELQDTKGRGVGSSPPLPPPIIPGAI